MFPDCPCTKLNHNTVHMYMNFFIFIKWPHTSVPPPMDETENIRYYFKAQECMRMSKSARECPRESESVQDCLRVSESVRECPRVSEIILKCPTVFESVQECPRVSEIILKCPTILCSGM